MDEELDIVTLEQEDGSELSLRVEKYFYYNGEEYVILSSDLTGEGPDDPDRYVMKVTPVEGEEDMEEFTPIEDEELEQRLIHTAETVLSDLDEDDEDE